MLDSSFRLCLDDHNRDQNGHHMYRLQQSPCQYCWNFNVHDRKSFLESVYIYMSCPSWGGTVYYASDFVLFWTICIYLYQMMPIVRRPLEWIPWTKIDEVIVLKRPPPESVGDELIAPVIVKYANLCIWDSSFGTVCNSLGNSTLCHDFTNMNVQLTHMFVNRFKGLWLTLGLGVSLQ